MRYLHVFTNALLPLSCAALHNGAPSDNSMPPKRVAIIGAGAGGSSAAYHLSLDSTSSGHPTEITVYEREAHIGGRTTTVNAWNDPHTPIELGGSIFVEVNHILVNASREFNLSIASEDRPKPADAPELGVWNGKEFVVITSGGDGWWEKAKLLWRYGLAPIKVNSLMKSTVGKFLQMYEEPMFPWQSLGDVVEKVGLLETTGKTGEQLLEENGIGGLFAEEIVQASTRVNYAQNLPLIHGLETMVCMAANGAMAVEGGNWKIFAHMIEKSGATLHLNTSVSQISKQFDGTYTVTTSSGKSATYDEVILAAPLQFTSLVIDPSPRHVPDEIPYVGLHVTLFASPHKISPEAFGLKASELVPQFVLTTLPPNEKPGTDPNGAGSPGFFSISIVSGGLNPHSTPSNRPETIYKIFSPHAIDSSFLSKILNVDVPDKEVEDDGPVTWIHHKLWHSYPYEYPRVTFEEIKLDDGLWYTSGIESFISTMETSALMGKNVARLVVEGWEGRRREEGQVFEGLKEQMGQKPLKAKL
ncbi:prenylcysteine oxidase-like protein 1 precursor [Amniculicola lignicola CBS 123094]|uniref:Prenylcysteine oxidase-like protein 1 n=1 Tax=Amniculicola lignicola CBS 123094 TaxID=1392246 RepID=A0A6A5X4D4_9PLEO|nr:prenylcysteine oxidase-like protein 1 precursor [Amniculicola lignicola CBS 123094]